MRVQKIGHSCLLIEEGGKRLLIDPGAWAFAPIGAMKPEDIGPVDVVLFTHEHTDHFSPEILKRIPVTHVVSHARIAELLKKEGIACEVIAEGERKDVNGFRIEALHAPHGEVLSEPPPNLAYLINRKLLHPGDSLTFSMVQPLPVLALPVAAPWMRVKEGVLLAKALKPARVIPIHEVIVADHFRPRLVAMVKEVLAKEGITFEELTYPQAIEI